MVRFVLATHKTRPGAQVVELWEGDHFIGQLTPSATPYAFRVITKYSLGVADVAAAPRATPVQVVEVTIGGRA